jgi:hypothetical protein
MNAFDIYNEFSVKNAKLNLPKDPVISSVYIPTIHKNFTNDAIYHVFETLFGCVTRIDTVQIQTPDNSVSNFKSAFVHFVAYVRPENVMDVINRGGEKVRINPNVNTGYMRKHFPQPNAKIRNKEFWLLIPNNALFPDTTLTLPQLRNLMDQLDGYILGNEEECESMKANRGFLAELEAKQSGQLKTDTSVNVHQLARNIELMEERISTGTSKPRRVITIKAKATKAHVGEAKSVEAPVGEAKAVEVLAKAVEDPTTKSIQDLTYYLLWSDDENEAKKQYASICASNRVLLVENILPDCHEYELMDNFNHYGLVESVKVIRDPDTKDALRAYALFSQAKDAQAAIAEINQDVEGGCRVSRLM